MSNQKVEILVNSFGLSIGDIVEVDHYCGGSVKVIKNGFGSIVKAENVRAI
jgi:hypothetical protein